MEPSIAVPTQQAMEALGWDKNKLRRWVAQLNMDPPKNGKGSWLFEPDALAVLEQVKTLQDAGHSDRSIRLRVTRAPDAPDAPGAPADFGPVIEALGRLAGGLPDAEDLARSVVGELTPHLERRARHADELLAGQRELAAALRELANERERTADLSQRLAATAMHAQALEARVAEQGRLLAAPPPPSPGVLAAITAAVRRVLGKGGPSHQRI